MNRVIYIKTTNHCNLKCAHCFSPNAEFKQIWDYKATLKWLRDFILLKKNNDSFSVVFHGGEPMLAPVPELTLFKNHLSQVSETISFSICTNLVYQLTEEKLIFLKSLDGVSTSWDPGIRFSDIRQLNLWKENVEKLVKENIDITLNISLTKKVIQEDILTLLLWIELLGISFVSFERITEAHGDVPSNIIPENKAVDAWYLELHKVYQTFFKNSELRITNLEEIYEKFNTHNPFSGTFSRTCEERIITINADGSIGGCPNHANKNKQSTIFIEPKNVLISDKRITKIAEERSRIPACIDCPVFQYCGSGCHLLNWQENICPQPKSLMMLLMEKENG